MGSIVLDRNVWVSFLSNTSFLSPTILSSLMVVILFRQCFDIESTLPPDFPYTFNAWNSVSPCRPMSFNRLIVWNRRLAAMASFSNFHY